jgi:ABC-type transport system involved in multi-copper enzyme maturation permease subunit
MAIRLGPGPVFFYECLTSSRRWQNFAARSLFVGFLLAALGVVWVSDPALAHPSIHDLARAGASFFYGMIGTELALVLLAAPAFTAGAICLDKARGSLTHLLVTDLSSAEIVLGKLAARLVPVLGLIACALPVLALAMFLGGIDPGAVLGAHLVLAGVAVLGCTLALTLSVWGKKTYEVLLLNYLLWAAALLAYPCAAAIDWNLTGGTGLPDWVPMTNPFWLVFAPYAEPTKVSLLDHAAFLGGCLALSVPLAAVAVWRVRPVAVAQLGKADRQQRPLLAGVRRRFRWWPFGASLDRNPVLWREWHRRRPSLGIRVVWAAFAGVAVVFSLVSVLIDVGKATPRGEMLPFVTGLQASVGLLLLSITAGTSLAEERVRGSLDVLLTTPLPTRTIVWGKWWGAYRATLLLAVLPTLTAAAVALETGYWANVVLILGLVLAYGAAITSLGLALATWIRRVNRALTVSVALYVLVAVGWMFAAMAFGHHRSAEGLASASPFYGVGLLTFLLGDQGGDRAEIYLWDVFWIVAYLSAAIALLAATLLTFDRCMGRVAQRPRPVRTWKPPRRRVPDEEEPLDVLPA